MAIPKEPRQLMINLMYLVLTAMLALNVSAEIINAFFLIDRGIEGSNSVIDESNAFAMTALEKNAEQDKEKYSKLVDAAKRVQQISREFNSYIGEIREEMVDMSGGYYPETDAKHPGHPKGYKNKDVTTNLLVNKGKGEEIKERILNTRQEILTIINNLKGMEGTAINDESIAELEKSITLGISDDWERSKKPSWSYFTFNQMPLASVFPIFRKFQNDMKSSEAAVINYLVKQVGAETFKVDNFIPIASAPKSYIIAGDEYKADITIGASSRSVYDNMVVKVNGSSLKVDDGIATFSARPNTPGIQKYKVDITLTNPTTGKIETYSKEFEYEVGRRSVTVAADKMNVLYIGVDNPVSVAAAGVSSNDLRVSASGGGINMRASSTGKYNVTVSQPGEAKITVSGGGLTPTTFSFRVKRIPDPVPRLGRSSGGSMGNGEFKAQEGLIALLENFDFDARCDIQGYDLVYIAKREDAVDSSNPGARFNERSRRLADRAKPGDTYYFRNIKARCPGDSAGRDIGTMVFDIR
ncbi:MAG TPA: gliding motility protein GldM [Saprospiraceae bacterium]|nr:gliding motility protein GldM [Saprospiraceae bacterium]HMP25829.1 gliding motility protein GldM [Saprospiraceae bacterium]